MILCTKKWSWIVDTQDGDQVIIPMWLWVSIGAIALLSVGGLGTWVGATLIDLGERVSVAETKIEGTSNSVTKIEANIDKMNDKLDKLLEKLSK